MPYLQMIPAYGRDYKSAKEVKADWSANKDFVIADISHPDTGRYCNQSDLIREGWRGTVLLRYSKLRKICSIKL